MKLRCLTSLIATIVMASTAGAAEIYEKDGNTLSMFGTIVGGHYFSKDCVKDGDNSFVRYGFSGKTYVNDSIIGFGVWEHEIALRGVERTNMSNSNRILLGYAGIHFGNFGSIDYGRNYGVLYDVGAWTDVVPGFGGDISISDNFLSGRSSNVVTYRNKNLFGYVNGLDVALQYQGKNNVNHYTGRTVKTANGEGYGVSASYSLDNGLSIAVAYNNSKRLASQISLDSNNRYSDNIEAYNLGVKYDRKGMYVAATYGETFNMTPFGNFSDVLNPDSVCGFANKAKNVELVAQYQFGFGLRPSISYVHSKSSDMDNSGYGEFLKRSITFGTGFVFNKNVCTTIDYRLNLLSRSDFSRAANISTDNVIALGIAYVF
ncbi:porin [Candidatus Blochmannia ocreatus (nom. nud.)]|uniref:Porin n=1 Tax=Candidatus Blochmannia ocreatus (nom. nud.) TaxID=251538 RepID=A0ABY4SUF0_9ENTR|nr:porin [Candidatus Blochmannia ocreatus]URJ24967.1 porin [Candidatus Blochmannia ocreatus]